MNRNVLTLNDTVQHVSTTPFLKFQLFTSLQHITNPHFPQSHKTIDELQVQTVPAFRVLILEKRIVLKRGISSFQRYETIHYKSRCDT